MRMRTSGMPGIRGDQKRARESLRPGATDGCELPYGCWELNLSPLQEQQVLLQLSQPKGKVSQFKVIVHSCGEDTMAKVRDSQSHWVQSQKQKGTQLTFSFTLHYSSAHGMELPTLKTAFPSSIKAPGSTVIRCENVSHPQSIITFLLFICKLSSQYIVKLSRYPWATY